MVLCHNILQKRVLPMDGVVVASVGVWVGSTVVGSVSATAWKYNMVFSTHIYIISDISMHKND